MSKNNVQLLVCKYMFRYLIGCISDFWRCTGTYFLNVPCIKRKLPRNFVEKLIFFKREKDFSKCFFNFFEIIKFTANIFNNFVKILENIQNVVKISIKISLTRCNILPKISLKVFHFFRKYFRNFFPRDFS